MRILYVLACTVLLCASGSFQKESACIYILCRESDLGGLKKTLKIFEEKFNSKFGYPYLIVNEKEFSEHFKKEILQIVKEAEFGVVPKAHWEYPPWVDVRIAKERMKRMEEKGIIYGGLESYRHMCRFFSGFFYQHPLAAKYQYYWRVEPDTSLECDVPYDVFQFMRENKKKYGFVISLHEYHSTVPSLWRTVKKFVSDYNTLYKKGDFWMLQEKNNLHRFITDEVFENYNLCHFWSNFEIGDFSFFRNKKYQMFFEYLDRTGGFFYERWGDAPVHTIGAALFLNRNEIHYFEDIGYTHPPFTHCPRPSLRKGACNCAPEKSADIVAPACTSLYKSVQLFSGSAA